MSALVDESPMRSASAGCICRDDTAAGEQRTNDTEAMRTPHPRFPSTYLPCLVGISDKRGWGTAIILEGVSTPVDDG
ncbi:hypothetical protein B0H19DRAFT_1245570 [Mycena capillaripes]|nr:hypothetical protein B0H19DRAFT_1245570 [Mycena capillaripes]